MIWLEALGRKCNWYWS